jgi:hypothetical protein
MLRQLLVAFVLIGLTSGPSVAEPLSPRIVGWESYFNLQWERAERQGRPVVRGYVVNEWGMPAARVQLLVDALDSQGTVLGQRVEWLSTGMLLPGMRSYFEVPGQQAATAYRVSVFAFDWVQVGGGDKD